jgi:ankyrin repeat protein
MRNETYLRQLIDCPYSLVTGVLRNLDTEEINTPLFAIGETLLIMLSASNKHLLTRYMLNRGDVNINHTNDTAYNDSALSWAVYNHGFECVQLLVEHGADVLIVTHIYGRNLLEWAYVRRDARIFEYLVSKGCDIGHVNFDKEQLSNVVMLYPYSAYLRRQERLLYTLINQWFDRFKKDYERGLIMKVMEFYC